MNTVIWRTVRDPIDEIDDMVGALAHGKDFGVIQIPPALGLLWGRGSGDRYRLRRGR